MDFISEVEIELEFPTPDFNLGTSGQVYENCKVAFRSATCAVSSSGTNIMKITDIQVSIPAGFIINIQIPNIALNPTNAGATSQNFQARTKWGGTIIDQTNPATVATKSYTAQTV